MAESNLIEFRSVGGQEVGDFESNRDDPGTLDVGWQGHRGYRGAAINRGLLEPENRQSTDHQAVNPVRLIQWGTIVKGFPGLARILILSTSNAAGPTVILRTWYGILQLSVTREVLTARLYSGP